MEPKDYIGFGNFTGKVSGIQSVYDLSQSEIYWTYIYEWLTTVSIISGLIFFFIIYGIATYIKYSIKHSENKSLTYKQVCCHSVGILITTVALSILVALIVYVIIHRRMYAIG